MSSSSSTPSGWDSDYRYEPQSLFEQSFRCLPFDKYRKPELESGNKIIMPESALSLLEDLPVSYPIFFKIQSSDKTSHCGVLEFGAGDGFVYMPRWMMKNLAVEEGGGVTLRDATLSKGCYMKLQPHAAAFVELADPKAVLETALRGFACVSAGDTIMVRYNERDYYLDVVEVKPGGEAVSLIEVDCMMDFAPPLDSVEPPPRREISERDGGEERDEREEELREAVNKFRPFTGVARRIDGTAVMVAEGCSGVAGEKKREKDGGKLVDEKIKKDGGVMSKSRPFVWTAPAQRLGRTAESGGEGEGKKREKDEGKEKFKPFTGRSRLLR